MGMKYKIERHVNLVSMSNDISTQLDVIEAERNEKEKNKKKRNEMKEVKLTFKMRVLNTKCL